MKFIALDLLPHCGSKLGWNPLCKGCTIQKKTVLVQPSFTQLAGGGLNQAAEFPLLDPSRTTLTPAKDPGLLRIGINVDMHDLVPSIHIQKIDEGW